MCMDLSSHSTCGMGLSVGVKGRERTARGGAEGCELAAGDEGGREAGTAPARGVCAGQNPAAARWGWWRGSTGAKAFGLGWAGRV